MSGQFRIYSLLVLGALSGACAVGKDSIGNEFELSFWLREGANKDPRIIEIYDHCCCSGKVAVARVARIPSFDQSEALEVEPVLEVSDRGAIVRRWGMPINSEVAGISGTRIIVPQGEGRGLSISETGDLAVMNLPKEADYGKLVDCPPIKEFEGSTYLRCFELRDIGSARIRHIAYEGPCT